MHAGKLVFAQLMEHLPLRTFHQCVARYSGRYPTLKFSHLDQFLCMAFAQLTYRESLASRAPTKPSFTIWAYEATSPRVRWPMPTSSATAASIWISR